MLILCVIGYAYNIYLFYIRKVNNLVAEHSIIKIIFEIKNELTIKYLNDYRM